ncbi:MAG: hypothetical protein NC432_07400 [Roseburia sp.]|nr:hypothetical protein [Roseburia sp.]MCM1096833.1 hypothetical protein [Ruminococcus flavefaciens]
MNRISDEVSAVKRRVNRHRETLDEAWKSAEVSGMDSAIEEIARRLNRLSNDLDDLSHDILITGQEIEAEGIRRDAAEAEVQRYAAEKSEKPTLERVREQAIEEGSKLLAGVFGIKTK